MGYGIAGTARADFMVDDSARASGSARPLEQHLGRFPGVVSATFNLGVMEVRIEYLPGAVDVATLRHGIEDFGYRVRQASDGGAAPGAEEYEATASCSEQVDFGDFAIARDLPAYRTTPIELSPEEPGEFTWTCGMNMMRGKLIVEER